MPLKSKVRPPSTLQGSKFILSEFDHVALDAAPMAWTMLVGRYDRVVPESSKVARAVVSISASKLSGVNTESP